MVDPVIFAISQKCLGWNLLLVTNLKFYGRQLSCLLSTHMVTCCGLSTPLCPWSVLNNLFSSQLANSIRTWYVFREKAVENLYGRKYSDLGASQCLWFDRNIRSKSKRYFSYEDWYDKGIIHMSDLLNPPHPGSKLFEGLILDFDVSHSGRRKYKCKIFPVHGLRVRISIFGWFDRIVNNIVLFRKCPNLLIPLFSRNVYLISEFAFG